MGFQNWYKSKHTRWKISDEWSQEIVQALEHQDHIGWRVELEGVIS